MGSLFKKKCEMRKRLDRNPAPTAHVPDEGLGNIGFHKWNCPLSLEHLHQHAVLCHGLIDVFHKPQHRVMALGAEYNQVSKCRIALFPKPCIFISI